MRPRPAARRAGLAIVAVVVVAAAACSSSGSAASSPASSARRAATAPPAGAPTTTSPPVAPAVWAACGSGLQCTRVTVPLSYAHPDGRTMAIGLTRLPATDPAGAAATLFFDAGGPGLSGDLVLRALQSFFPAALHQHLDIVAMSRRGTGRSGKLQCGPAPAAVTAHPLDDIAGLAATYATGLASCRTAERTVGDVSTVTAARDLDRARQALGRSQIDYLGLSYGTVLGDAYLQQFPRRVRAMVLDGAVDPAEPLLTASAESAAVQQRDLATALAGCRAQGTACPLGADPVATYHAVATRLAAHPEPGDPPVTDGDLAAATLMYLTVPSLTAGFFPAVAAAATGDGSKLRAVAAGLYQDIDGSSVVGPYWATVCEDTAARPSAAAFGAAATRLARTDPDTGAESVAYGAAGCSGWPAARQPVRTAPVHGGPPVLVIGGTLDPQTPVAWSRRVVAELGPGVGRLVVRQSQGHTAFLNQPGPCIVDLEVADLLDAQAPTAAVTTCPR